MKSNPLISKHRQGFTLVEILVVAVIIAILATLSLTGARKMMDSASSTNTVSHLKQLSTAAQLFSSENGGALMHETRTTVNGQRRGWWQHLLVTLSPDLAANDNYGKSPGDEFAQSVKIFGDSKALKTARGKLPNSGHNSWRTYAYNNRIGIYEPDSPGSMGWGVGARFVNQVDTPHKLILFAQKNLEGNRYSYLLQPEDAASGKVYFDLYGGSTMVGFFDGHVEKFSKNHFPTNGGINPGTKQAYSPRELNEFWFGRSTALPPI